MRKWSCLIAAILLLWASTVSAQIKRPLVFIPGILGTRLCDEQQTLVWGGLGSLGNFHKLDLSPDGPGLKLHPCGLVTRIVSLGPFWQADVYTQLIAHLRTIGYDEQKSNLFIFDYDWRQSNAATADAFAAFAAEHPELREREFDVLAHSMGGLVVRLFVLRHPKVSPYVKRIITLGTPFQGTARALEVVAKGWGPIPNALAGRIRVVRRTALSFPSLYELFPSYKFGRSCCRLGTIGQIDSPSFDIFDFALWEKNQWATDVYDTQQNRTYLKDNLERARIIRSNIEDRPRDAPPEIHFVGTKRDTPFYVYVDPQAPNLDRWQFAVGPGDSVVPAWSAADAFANSLAGSRPAFPPHATIFTDENLEEALRLELTESLPPRKGTETIARTTEGDKVLDRVAVNVDRYFIEQSGEHVIVRATLQFAERLGQAGLHLTVRQADVGNNPVPMQDVTSKDQRDADTFMAEATLTIVGEPNAKRIDILIPGVGIQSSYVEIVE